MSTTASSSVPGASGPAAGASAPAPAPALTAGPSSGLAALTLGAIGIVYGDIGTSPLYTVREIFSPAAGLPLDTAHVTGAISCIVWALMLVVTLKYVILILRADNRGEGGGLALTALAAQAVGSRLMLRRVLLLLGVFGATLFYGDSIITPAVSVLGALEGLEVATPALRPAIVPLTLVILVLLFMLQRRGTAQVGALFGPVVCVWFLALGGIGLVQVLREPAILAALDPRQALHFLSERGAGMLPALGAIVLALTGAEALYADMGHFGRRPIRLAWLGLVKPALVLNYLGQGALLMREPAAIENPFYRMFPPMLLWPALVLATLAAIIASQAVITGAFSMTRQAMQLGFLPRMTVRHTSARESGQIYLPMVNGLLLVGVIVAVLAFRSSSALAGAYGIAVTLTMLITTLLTFFVVRHGWRVPLPLAAGATLVFALIDLLLFAGCAVKLLDGGWFPLAVGLTLFVMMSTWRRGRAVTLQAIRGDGLALAPFLGTLDMASVPCVPRTAVYAVADPLTVPQALLHNLKHNQVLHQRNLVLTVQFAQTPWVDEAERARVVPLGPRFWQVTLHFGFMETPDVPRALQAMRLDGPALEPAATSYFLSRETIVPTRGPGMAVWREHLFAAMTRNAGSVAGFFRLPDNAVVELGTRVQI